MNVALITFEFPPENAIGGIGSYMNHLAELLYKAGIKVTVFSADTSATEIKIVDKIHCKNYLIPAKTMENFRNDVVSPFSIFHTNTKVDVLESPEVGACALHVKQAYPEIPLIVKMHTPGVLITRINNTYVPVMRKLRFIAGSLKRGKFDAGHWRRSDKNRFADPEYQICMKADTLLSPSKALKKWAVTYWRIPADKIEIIPNAFSVDDALIRLPIEKRADIISFVGKLTTLKGVHSFTKAIPGILGKNRGYKIMVVGRDEVEQGQSMRKYMEDHLSGYLSDIIFTGVLNKEQLKEVYGMSKVCVFPSLWENYPNVLLEAIASGAAVAASKVGGIPEIIDHGVTGVLFDPKDPEHIADSVNALLADKDRRIRYATAARKKLIDQANSSVESKSLQVYTSFMNTVM